MYLKGNQNEKIGNFYCLRLNCNSIFSLSSVYRRDICKNVGGCNFLWKHIFSHEKILYSSILKPRGTVHLMINNIIFHIGNVFSSNKYLQWNIVFTLLISLFSFHLQILIYYFKLFLNCGHTVLMKIPSQTN